jgi:type VI secretion system secreted protein Hcp
LPPPSSNHAIEVVEATDSVFSPTDPQSGLPTGQRRYEGIVIRKPLDKTSPQIAQALAHNENLNDVELLVYIEDRSTRQLVHRFTYEFDQARVTQIKREMFGRPSNSNSTLVPRPEEEITLRFGSIRFTDVVNSVEFEDNFSSPADVPVDELEEALDEEISESKIEAAE